MKANFIRAVFLAVVAAVVSLSYRAVRADWVAFRKAEAMFASGDCEGSSAIYRKLAGTRFARRDIVLARICECRLNEGNVPGAKSLASDIDPDVGEIWMRLAGVFARYGHFDDAGEFYRRGLKSFPDSRNGRLFYARTLVAVGNFDLAAAEFRRVLNTRKSWVKKLSDFRKPVEDEPAPASDWQVQLELARALTYSDRHADARVLLEKLVLARPDSVEAQMDLARLLFWGGEPGRALEISEAFDDAALSREGILLKAELKMIARDYAGTEASLRRILKRDPEDDQARFKLAEILSWGKKFGEAEREYRLLVSRRPSEVQVRRKYAQVLHWMGRHREAAAQLRQSLGRE